MSWQACYLPEADDYLRKLDNSQRIIALKAIKKVSAKPQAKAEGGYGTPLGNKKPARLVNLFKIKLKKSGLRIVYKLIHTDDMMLVIVIGVRADNEVYIKADARVNKSQL